LLIEEIEIASNGTNNHHPVIEYRISYKMLGTSLDSLSFCESNMFGAVEFWIEREDNWISYGCMKFAFVSLVISL